MPYLSFNNGSEQNETFIQVNFYRFRLIVTNTKKILTIIIK